MRPEWIFIGALAFIGIPFALFMLAIAKASMRHRQQAWDDDDRFEAAMREIEQRGREHMRSGMPRP